MPFLRRTAACSLVLTVAILTPVLASAQNRLNDAMPPETSAPAAASPNMNGIAHIAIRVKDMNASVDFYHKLGFDHPFDRKNGDVVSQSFIKINDKQYIEIYPVTPRDTQTGFLHLCFEGMDLNALHDFYVSEGLTPISVRTAGAGNLLFTMKGPDQPSGPQNIEYTQYMPASFHSKDVGQHLGPDRVGDRMTVVALSMNDPAAARTFYIQKLGFSPSHNNAARLDLPGNSGESVEIVPASDLGFRSSIVLSTPDIEKSAAQLKRQQVEFKRAASTSTDAAGHAHTVDMISVTDPDGNIIRIAQTK
ncbi:MAG TPA: VOC family protein [Acidobacteriaceae bacterium]|nr:VOC family protein [Acidobacteriaceae bacterium]